MRITTSFVLLAACLFGIPAQAEMYELYGWNRPSRATTPQISRYRHLAAEKHAIRQFHRLLQLQQLREKVRLSGLDGFAGARPEDTAWALAIIQDKQAMEQIQTSFQKSWKDRSGQEVIVGQADSPQMITAPFSKQRAAFSATPGERSSIRPIFTKQGPKIAATTQLNAAGMEIQSQFGCAGCHRK